MCSSDLEDAGAYMRNMERLKMKHYNAASYMPKPALHAVKGATVGILAYGSTESAVLEAQYHLSKDDGINADFLRIRAIPFTEEVTKFIEKYDQIFIVEMNRDGQMYQILLTEYPQYAAKFKSVAYHDGLPAAAKWVREGILAKYEAEGKRQKAVSGKQKKVSAKKVTTKAVADSKPSKKPVKKAVAKSKTSAKAKKK